MKNYYIFFLLVTVFLTYNSSILYAKEKVLIFSAASTTDALTEVCNLFNENPDIRAVPSFASSSTLAKQIQNGAPADIFISANIKWMDFLEKNKLITKNSRFDLLSNKLAMIAPVNSKINLKIVPQLPLIKYLDNGFIAMGDPDHVPVGIYGKMALQHLGIWDSIIKNVARTSDVRRTLFLVETGQSPLGIVYLTDAYSSEKVKIIDIFPDESYPKIVYPVAIISKRDDIVVKKQVKIFISFLTSLRSRQLFKKYGFIANF